MKKATKALKKKVGNSSPTFNFFTETNEFSTRDKDTKLIPINKLKNERIFNQKIKRNRSYR